MQTHDSLDNISESCDTSDLYLPPRISSPSPSPSQSVWSADSAKPVVHVCAGNKRTLTRTLTPSRREEPFEKIVEILNGPSIDRTVHLVHMGAAADYYNNTSCSFVRLPAYVTMSCDKAKAEQQHADHDHDHDQQYFLRRFL